MYHSANFQLIHGIPASSGQINSGRPCNTFGELFAMVEQHDGHRWLCDSDDDDIIQNLWISEYTHTHTDACSNLITVFQMNHTKQFPL